MTDDPTTSAADTPQSAASDKRRKPYLTPSGKREHRLYEQAFVDGFGFGWRKALHEVSLHFKISVPREWRQDQYAENRARELIAELKRIWGPDPSTQEARPDEGVTRGA